MRALRESGEEMSGPKGYSWDVSRAELARQAARDQARAQCAMLRDVAVGICAQIDSLGGASSTAPGLPHIADAVTEVEAARIAEAYEREVARLDAHLDDVRRSAVEAAFAVVRTVPTSASIRMPSLRRATAESAGSDRPSAEVERERALDGVARALGELRDEDLRQRWLAEATALAVRDDVSARDTLDAIRLAAEAELRRQRRGQEVRAAADQLRLSIADVASAAARDLRDALDSVTDATQLRRLSDAARRVRAEWDADAPRRYVVARTAAALAEMGHQVDAEFVVSADRGDFAVADRRDDADYATQLRFLPQTRTLLVNTVSLRQDTSPAADAAAEERMCAAVDHVVSRLEGQGVRLVKTHGRQPGEVPIERRWREEVAPAIEESEAVRRETADARRAAIRRRGAT